MRSSSRSRPIDFPGWLRDGTRDQLREGTWNATTVLLEAGDAIERMAVALPHLHGFAGGG